MTVSTLIGTVLVIGGIALVNSRYGTRPLLRRAGTASQAGTPEAAAGAGTGRT